MRSIQKAKYFEKGDRVKLSPKAAEMFPTHRGFVATVLGRPPRHPEYVRIRFDNLRVAETYHIKFLVPASGEEQR